MRIFVLFHFPVIIILDKKIPHIVAYLVTTSRSKVVLLRLWLQVHIAIIGWEKYKYGNHLCLLLPCHVELWLAFVYSHLMLKLRLV